MVRAGREVDLDEWLVTRKNQKNRRHASKSILRGCGGPALVNIRKLALDKYNYYLEYLVCKHSFYLTTIGYAVIAL